MELIATGLVRVAQLVPTRAPDPLWVFEEESPEFDLTGGEAALLLPRLEEAALVASDPDEATYFALVSGRVPLNALSHRELIKKRQNDMNAWTRQWLKGVNPLKVDGVWGRLCNRRTMTVKYYLGYGKNRNGEWTSAFVRRMRHPNDAQYFPGRMHLVGRERRAQQKREWEREQIASYLVPGVANWGGRAVAKCAVPYLDWARAHGWSGGVNSGWRDPWYSQQLCFRMCGAPTCSGKCAGLTSNHVGNTCSRFAIDVSDYFIFGHLMRSYPVKHGQVRIWNDLGSRDPVHFSPSGR